ncbi:transmembrane sensor [Paucibacter oligotrophus]|uniref:Transmembrane sensor n=1 Tax=Roseateles oligotrophus TaxID=1769250 RepID=A0A840LIL9_9BURK|nr:FecR family protein [Roseateles oligotrophus]MBB4845117.1 transmembrane sensor [Roseateles oligotrophus]
MRAEPPPIPPQVRQRAAEWLVELQADTADDATRQRWRQWRDAHPDHERAWQRMAAFSERLQGMPAALARNTLAATAKSSSDVVRTPRRQAIKTLAVLLFAGGTAWTLREHTPWPELVADARTGPGERRSLTLSDGTRVELNADTALDIRYSGEERLLRLLRGEILITTAHDDAPGNERNTVGRPFLVETAHGRIRALGTRFAVRRLEVDANTGAADASLVNVYEGAVAIRPRDVNGQGLPAEGADPVLRAGEAARFTRQAVTPAQAADPATVAWAQGMIVAQDMPLADFVAELNRQTRRDTETGAGRWAVDPAVARLKVSGTYPLAEPAKVLDMLQTALPIRAERQRRWWGGAEVVLAAR